MTVLPLPVGAFSTKWGGPVGESIFSLALIKDVKASKYCDTAMRWYDRNEMLLDDSTIKKHVKWVIFIHIAIGGSVA